MNDCTSPANLCPFQPDGATRESTCGSADRSAAVVCRSSLVGGGDAHRFEYRVQPMQAGATYYTDRDYVFGALPSALQNLNGIATPNDDKVRSSFLLFARFFCYSSILLFAILLFTPNDDKSSTCAAASETGGPCVGGAVNDPEYLCFDVDQQARVYVLYDQVRLHFFYLILFFCSLIFFCLRLFVCTFSVRTKTPWRRPSPAARSCFGRTSSTRALRCSLARRTSSR